MSSPRKLNILVAPLDWGLGHTTRCIPIIDELIKRDATVILAGNEIQRAILQEAFPQCLFLPLKGYNVRYSESDRRFTATILQQFPSILSSIKAENKWLKEVVVRHRIDGVISDNRFGLYHAAIPSVFVTHQLQIRTGRGKVADAIIRRLNYQQVNRYASCWIPDLEGASNLAGELSHPPDMPRTDCRYIGPLTRLSRPITEAKEYEVLFLLSGPEPQRTIFERMVFAQVANLSRPALIIRGLPLNNETPEVENATVYNHLPKEELERLMLRAAFIVCRSGYSSVMDINAIRAKAIFIPTPGQTEQEYLGSYLMNQGFAVSCGQHDFELPALLAQASCFPYEGFVDTDNQLLSCAVKRFLQDCGDNAVSAT